MYAFMYTICMLYHFDALLTDSPLLPQLAHNRHHLTCNTHQNYPMYNNTVTQLIFLERNRNCDRRLRTVSRGYFIYVPIRTIYCRWIYVCEIIPHLNGNKDTWYFGMLVYLAYEPISETLNIPVTSYLLMKDTTSTTRLQSHLQNEDKKILLPSS